MDDYESSLQSMVRFAVEQTGAERGALLLKKGKKTELQIVSYLHCDEDSLDDIQEISSRIPRDAITETEPIIIENANQKQHRNRVHQDTLVPAEFTGHETRDLAEIQAAKQGRNRRAKGKLRPIECQKIRQPCKSALFVFAQGMIARCSRIGLEYLELLFCPPVLNVSQNRIHIIWLNLTGEGRHISSSLQNVLFKLRSTSLPGQPSLIDGRRFD